MKLGWYWRTWKLSRLGRLGHIQFYDWFPLFEISWSFRERWVTLRTRGNVADYEPCYERKRSWGARSNHET
jgi:hypothetical protein